MLRVRAQASTHTPPFTACDHRVRCAVLCCDVMCCVVMCCDKMCCDVLFFTVLWCGVPVCSVPPVLCAVYPVCVCCLDSPRTVVTR